MTPKEARLILRDGGLKSLIETCHAYPEADAAEYLIRVGKALKSLQLLVIKISKKKKPRAKK